MSPESDSHGIATSARDLRQIRDRQLPAEAESLDQHTQQAIEAVARLVDDAAVG